MEPLASWIAEKEEVADQLDEYGASERAELIRKLAGEVERVVEGWRNELLSIEEAADESGYTKEGLRKMVREGRIPDSRPSGSSGPHRIRRADLPKKPPPPPDPAESQGDPQGGTPAERLVHRATRYSS